MQVNGQHNKIEYNTNIFINADADCQEISDWKGKLISIIQQIPSKADSLKPIIQFIVTTISPAKIYMLQHKDAGNPAKGGYIDLLIIMSGKNSVPFIELEPILEMPYVKNQRVSCSLHSEDNVLEGLRNGHIFYSLNCIPEKLVYDDKTTQYPTTTPEALQEAKNRLKEKFTQAFEKSQHFYESAVSLHKSHPSQIIAFMLHQATELTYRGILQSLNGYDKKTHEIRAFKKHIRRCAPSLNTVFPDNTEEEKRLLDILEKAYLSARYEDQYEIQENDLDVLFTKVKQLQATAKEIVEEKLLQR